MLEQRPETIILGPEMHRGQWKEQFGNGGPIFLEIGMGKGQFICGMSAQMPFVNFLGLEKYDSVAYRATQRLLLAPRRNVLLLRGEAENLANYFAPSEIGRIYLNFSDPWPRGRHIKRRLTHSGFLDKYRAVLAPGGEICLKTDNRKFFEFTLQHMNEYGMVFEHVSLDLHAEEPEDNVRTEYEEAKSAGGSAIYQLICKFP
jgi:tRNA (guanine-N7-)-methyltransferase